ncbi:MAG: DNA polymerase I [Gammaproteobacteria bacterium]
MAILPETNEDNTVKKDTFILVDGSSYLFRAFHALPPLTNSKGQPTGAIHGVMNMLRKLIKEFDPKYLAIIFDAKGKTFRNDLFPDYKANRPPMDEDLRCQIEPLHELIRASGWPLMVIDNVEADDVIGTLSVQASKQNLRTVISTGDKDMAQLVDDNVFLINTMNNGTLMDRDGVVEKFGVKPDQIIDYLTLMGDKVDNSPGVEKVGPKTAVKWINEYGSLDGVIENAENIKGKVGENLRVALDQLPLSKQLATIVLDVTLDRTPTELIPTAAEKETLIDLYTQLEFKTWLRELSSDQDYTPQAGSDDDESEQEKNESITSGYETILTEDQLDLWIEKLKKADHFAFDTETTSLDYMQAEIVGVSFSVKTGQAAYVPCAHDYPGAPDQISRDVLLEKLKPILEDPDQKKIGQNLKYDKNVLANYSIELNGIEFDTMLESYVLDSTATRHNMDALALKYLGLNTIHFEDIAGKGAKQLTFNQIPLEQAGPYAAEDADITLQLHERLHPELRARESQTAVFEKIELPLVSILSRIERNGVKVDAKMLKDQSQQLAKRMLEIEEQAYEDAGKPFNMNSPKQIQVILFEEKELPIISKTPKGQPSTAENVLQELAQDYLLPKLILENRSLSKLKSTYTDKLPLQIDQKTDRIHTSYHQAVAATGRLSSSDPNLQNIPIRTEEGRRIRQAFIAPEGYKLMASDYSQIELRIMAHLSGDARLLEAFKNGEDIHKATAAEVFNVELADVETNQRRAAKAINFGLIYGMSAFGLAKQLDVARGEAQDYIDLYFDRYPSVKTFMDDTRTLAHEQGFVETVFGRRLYLPEINSRNGQRRQYAERTAINAPMQGTAADIIKLAMIKVDHWLNEENIDAKMIMQVHDELVLEVAEKEIEPVKEKIESIMTSAAELNVPLVVDTGIGDNWDEAH